MIQVDGNAPGWAQRSARDVQTEIDSAIGLFLSRTPYTVAGLTTINPATNKNRLALLSDGTFWLAKSDGTDWLYPDNTAV